MHHRRTWVAVAAALALLPAAHAIEIDTPDPDLKVRLDLTPKYSTAYRLKNPWSALTRFDVGVDPGTLNEDDGDHNFRRGLISSRLDLLGELDITAKNFGGRISGNAWHDSVYLRNNRYQGTEIYANGVLDTSVDLDQYKLTLLMPNPTTATTSIYNRINFGGTADMGTWEIRNNNTILTLIPPSGLEEPYIIKSYTPRKIVLIIERDVNKTGPDEFEYVLEPF